AAFKFDDLVTTGKTTGDTDGAHGRFGTRGNQSHFFNGRHQIADGFCNLYFSRSGSTITQAEIKLVLQGFDYRGVTVSQNQRAPCAYIIYIAIVVFVVQPWSFGMVEEQGCTTYTPEGAYR